MTRYLFKNVVGEDGVLIGGQAAFRVENGTLKNIGEHQGDLETVDYSQYTVIPGIIDIHNHGYMGWSAASHQASDILSYTKALPSAGVTGILPTAYELKSLLAIVEAQKEVCGAEILGIHAEGPFLNPKKKGAFALETIEKPSIERAKEMVDTSEGLVKIMTIAPDVEGAEEVIAWLAENGVIASAGHTLATHAQLKESKEWGISSITHLGNAMLGIGHREVGTLGAAILDKDLNCELIADFHHVSREMIEIILSVKDSAKITLISDSADLAGCKPGKYPFLDSSRSVIMNEEGLITLPDGTLAGSGKSVIHGIKNFAKELEIPLNEVVKMTSLNQAKLLGLSANKGSIKEGKDADFVVIDDEFNVIATYVKGKKVFEKGMEEKLINPKFETIRNS